MSAVKGPFVFTSDVWQDSFIDKAKQARCGALALQLGVAPPAAADKTRYAGLQVIGWGACSIATGNQLGAMRPAVWMPQAENSEEFEALIASLRAAHGNGMPCEPVMTSGGMEPEGNPTDAQKVNERVRRRGLLRGFGITKVWVEVYKQDADRSGQAILGDVDFMCGFFEDAYGFEIAYPVVGLWNNYPLSSYNLTNHEGFFGAWRAEQMDDARYAEIAALVPPPPPPSPTVPTLLARSNIVGIGERWEAGVGGPKPLTRITLAKRICSSEILDKEWKAYGQAIAGILDAQE